MTTSTKHPASDPPAAVEQGEGWCRAMTRSSSAHPADWGRAIALALEYLAVQVAYTVREPELGVLVGRDVRLHFDALDDGVEITAELDAAHMDSRRGSDSHVSQRDLRISVGYGYGESPNADNE